MQAILFKNQPGTTLASPVSNVATTASLSPGSGALFPSPGANQYFSATFTDAATGLLNEIVYVTGISGDIVTIERAQEGTVALNWNAGDYFRNLVTAGYLTGVQQGVVVVSGVTSSTGVTLTAAEILGGVIMRSGPSAGYADTTDTAANIVGAIAFPVVGQSFKLRIVNTVAEINTLAFGLGVTPAGTTTIAASTWRDYVGVITALSPAAITLTGTGSGTL